MIYHKAGFKFLLGLSRSTAVALTILIGASQLRAETPEEQIARLKAELKKAEMAAQQKGNSLRQSNRDSVAFPTEALVVIEGNKGSGSGFIAKMRGRTFVITNIHVLGAARGAKFRTLDGTPLKIPNTAFLSAERDIAILPIEWDGRALETGTSLRNIGAAIGDKITVCGNSDGAGVATQLEGEISGIGPIEIEVTAKFIPGNSGSPVIHLKSGEIVGIASYLKDLRASDKWTEDSELKDIRRFAFRFDGNIKWQQFTLEEIFKQGEILAAYEDRTRVLAHTVHMMRNKRTIVTGYKTHKTLGYLFDEVDEGFSWNRGTSSSSNNLKLERFTKGLRRELSNERSSTKKKLTVQYYQNRFSQIDPLRDVYLKQLNQSLY